MIDRAHFYAIIRKEVFGNFLKTPQVEGINAVLDYWEKELVAPFNSDVRWLAYALATMVIETDHTMQPIKEKGGNAYFTSMYDIRGRRPSVARQLGNLSPGDGARFCGRGLVQTTGRTNYKWASTVLGVDCVAMPDRLLQQDGAAKLMFAGMIGGHYTSRKLPMYFNDKTDDPVGARRIINGQDRAGEIADIHDIFVEALTPELAKAA